MNLRRCILAISGYATHGKDSFAKWLTEENSGFYFDIIHNQIPDRYMSKIIKSERFAFADAAKDEVHEIIPEIMSENKEIRRIHYINYAQSAKCDDKYIWARKIPPNVDLIITDLRFKEEVEYLRQLDETDVYFAKVIAIGGEVHLGYTENSMPKMEYDLIATRFL